MLKNRIRAIFRSVYVYLYGTVVVRLRLSRFDIEFSRFVFVFREFYDTIVTKPRFVVNVVETIFIT